MTEKLNFSGLGNMGKQPWERTMEKGSLLDDLMREQKDAENELFRKNKEAQQKAYTEADVSKVAQIVTEAKDIYNALHDKISLLSPKQKEANSQLFRYIQGIVRAGEELASLSKKLSEGADEDIKVTPDELGRLYELTEFMRTTKERTDKVFEAIGVEEVSEGVAAARQDLDRAYKKLKKYSGDNAKIVRALSDSDDPKIRAVVKDIVEVSNTYRKISEQSTADIELIELLTEEIERIFPVLEEAVVMYVPPQKEQEVGEKIEGAREKPEVTPEAIPSVERISPELFGAAQTLREEYDALAQRYTESYEALAKLAEQSTDVQRFGHTVNEISRDITESIRAVEEKEKGLSGASDEVLRIAIEEDIERVRMAIAYIEDVTRPPLEESKATIPELPKDSKTEKREPSEITKEAIQETYYLLSQVSKEIPVAVRDAFQSRIVAMDRRERAILSGEKRDQQSYESFMLDANTLIANLLKLDSRYVSETTKERVRALSERVTHEDSAETADKAGERASTQEKVEVLEKAPESAPETKEQPVVEKVENRQRQEEKPPQDIVDKVKGRLLNLWNTLDEQQYQGLEEVDDMMRRIKDTGGEFPDKKSIQHAYSLIKEIEEFMRTHKAQHERGGRGHEQAPAEPEDAWTHEDWQKWQKNAENERIKQTAQFPSSKNKEKQELPPVTEEDVKNARQKLAMLASELPRPLFDAFIQRIRKASVGEIKSPETSIGTINHLITDIRKARVLYEAGEVRKNREEKEGGRQSEQLDVRGGSTEEGGDENFTFEEDAPESGVGESVPDTAEKPVPEEDFGDFTFETDEPEAPDRAPEPIPEPETKPEVPPNPAAGGVEGETVKSDRIPASEISALASELYGAKEGESEDFIRDVPPVSLYGKEKAKTSGVGGKTESERSEDTSKKESKAEAKTTPESIAAPELPAREWMRRAKMAEIQYQNAYEHFLRERSLKERISDRLFGIKPPKELENLKKMSSDVARKARDALLDLSMKHRPALKELAELPGGIDVARRKRDYLSETMEEREARDKAIASYERLQRGYYKKFLVDPLTVRNEVQRKIVAERLENEWEGTKKFRAALSFVGEKMAQNRKEVMIASMVTGVSASAIIGGPLMIPAALVGIVTGKVSFAAVNSFLQHFWVKKRERGVARVHEKIEHDALAYDLQKAEKDINVAQKELRKAKIGTMASSIAAASVAGILAGGYTRSAFAEVGTSVGPNEVTPAKPSGPSSTSPESSTVAGIKRSINEAVEKTGQEVAKTVESVKNTISETGNKISEAVSMSERGTYTVAPRDTLWKIVEKNELAGVASSAERSKALSGFVKYLDTHPDAMQKIGIAGGNPHILHAGDTLNMTELHKAYEMYGGIKGSGALEAGATEGVKQSVLQSVENVKDAVSASVDTARETISKATQEASNLTQLFGEKISESAQKVSELLSVPDHPVTPKAAVIALQVEHVPAKSGFLGFGAQPEVNTYGNVFATKLQNLDVNTILSGKISGLNAQEVAVAKNWQQWIIDNRNGPAVRSLGNNPRLIDMVNMQSKVIDEKTVLTLFPSDRRDHLGGLLGNAIKELTKK